MIIIVIYIRNTTILFETLDSVRLAHTQWSFSKRERKEKQRSTGSRKKANRHERSVENMKKKGLRILNERPNKSPHTCYRQNKSKNTFVVRKEIGEDKNKTVANANVLQ